ncbi:hypothetical protein TNIN_486671 [Trichonephila inaurata madagascariensis]|uniref:Uncharacterized protein n=1 Tax=Trichonephila inaurata madagascariensis TaxID=2747483 RepID=A0A8X6Y7I0_9ARAC|nr:hypothetical protein TNIN_486671 [Trichonephila inaurata madagascariensis]
MTNLQQDTLALRKLMTESARDFIGQKNMDHSLLRLLNKITKALPLTEVKEDLVGRSYSETPRIKLSQNRLPILTCFRSRRPV